jgi:hypothetical protein
LSPPQTMRACSRRFRPYQCCLDSLWPAKVWPGPGIHCQQGAIPEVGLHGRDIIREPHTGKLFVLEINPGGNTWSFSSPWAALLRRELNMPDLSVQFDAWRVCARLLVERTRNEAE